MNASFSLILVVVGSYVAAHVAFGWLARRYMVVSGAEYLLLGVLLGPQVSGLISVNVFSGFAPFMTLALGWIGALIGAQFYLPDLVRIGTRPFKIAFTEAVLSATLVGVMMFGVFWWLFDLPLEDRLAAAVVVGAIGAASSPAGIGLISQVLQKRRLVVQQLQLTASIDAVVAVVAFSLVLSIDHVPTDGLVRQPTSTEWAVISLAIGLIGGALFHLFLGDETKVDRLFIGLIGAIILASGAAAYLRLSPLLPTMLVGLILVNTSRNRDEIRKALSALERPIYFVLLIFAGAAWVPSGGTWVIPAILFVAARTIAKLLSAPIAGALNGASLALGPHWGRGLLGQGGLAVAIGLNFLLHEANVLANAIFTATLVSVLVTDVTSARLAESAVRSQRRQLLQSAPPLDAPEPLPEATVDAGR